MEYSVRVVRVLPSVVFLVGSCPSILGGLLYRDREVEFQLPRRFPMADWPRLWFCLWCSLGQVFVLCEFRNQCLLCHILGYLNPFLYLKRCHFFSKPFLLHWVAGFHYFGRSVDIIEGFGFFEH